MNFTKPAGQTLLSPSKAVRPYQGRGNRPHNLALWALDSSAQKRPVKTIQHPTHKSFLTWSVPLQPSMPMGSLALTHFEMYRPPV
jgi:hypothetical protein